MHPYCKAFIASFKNTMGDSKMWYVNMNDTFMARLCPGKGNPQHYCVACETHEQATAILRAALERPEMKYVKIASRPRRTKGGLTTIRAFSEVGGPWKDFWKGE